MCVGAAQKDVCAVGMAPVAGGLRREALEGGDAGKQKTCMKPDFFVGDSAHSTPLPPTSRSPTRGFSRTSIVLVLSQNKKVKCKKGDKYSVPGAESK